MEMNRAAPRPVHGTGSGWYQSRNPAYHGIRSGEGSLPDPDPLNYFANRFLKNSPGNREG